jgi:long-chain acyl-CoA synthetase
LRKAAAHFPDKAALIFEDRRLSYSKFGAEVQRLARKLIASGVCPGDRVALHMHNCSDLAISCFACLYAGAIAVPVNTRMKAKEIEYVLTHSGASLYLGQPELFLEIEDIQAGLSGIRQFARDWRELEDCLPAPHLPALTADQPAAILYTSGTTARPKGAVHTHRTLLNAARGLSLEGDDVAAIVTPMVHAMAFLTLLASVDKAATAVIPGCFEPEAVLDAIARYRCTYMPAMPVMYRALIAAQKARPRDVRSGKRYLAGGDSVPPELKSEFARCFGRPLHEGFGITETGLIATNWSAASSPAGSFGRAVPGVDIEVANANGEPVTAGTVGEMIVRSAGSMVGYWNDRVATEKAITDRWFHTGDLVWQDCDGYLYFHGRKKEIIVRGGSNISPQEVEAVLYQHPGVREAGVAGVSDAIWGERVVAFVNQRAGQTVTADELIGFVAKRLAAYKTPEEVVFLDSLPKNAAGKIQRRALRDCIVRPIS